MRNVFDSDSYIPYKGAGSLVPHVKLLNDRLGAFSLRQLFSILCYQHGRSLDFLIPLTPELHSLPNRLSSDNTLIIDFFDKDKSTSKYPFYSVQLSENESALTLLKSYGQSVLLYRGDGHL